MKARLGCSSLILLLMVLSTAILVACSVSAFSFKEPMAENLLATTNKCNVTVIVKDSGGSLLAFHGLKPKVNITNIDFQKTWVFYDNNITLTNVDPGNYTVTVYWLGVRVGSASFQVAANETVTKTVSTSTVKVKIEAIDDSGNKVSDVHFTLRGPPNRDILFTTGNSNNDTYVLPYGTYKIVSAWYNWHVEGGNIRVTFTVSPDEIEINRYSGVKDIAVPFKSRVEVCFYTIDGKPFCSDNAMVKLYYTNGNKILVGTYSLEGENLIELNQVPYGNYTVEVYLKGRRVYEGALPISGSTKNKISLTVYLLTSIIVQVLDLDGLPLRNAKITVTKPSGETLTLTTSAVGELNITTVYPGTYVFMYNWRGAYVVEKTLIIKPVKQFRYEVVFPLKRYSVAIREKHGRYLPPGLSVTVKYGNLVVAKALLNKSTDSFEVSLGRIVFLRGFSYTITVSWAGNRLLDRMFTPESIGGECAEFQVSFCKLRIYVETLGGIPLSRAEVLLTLPNGTTVHMTANADGVVNINYAVAGQYLVTVKWWGLKVADEGFEIGDVEVKEVKLIAGVRTLKVKVINALGNPLSGANVTLRTELVNGSKVSISVLTDSTGIAVFPNVPLKAIRSMSITVTYGGKSTIVGSPIFENGSTQVSLDVLLVIGGVALSTAETAGLAVAIAAAACGGVYVYRRYRGKREEGLFVESGLEEKIVVSPYFEQTAEVRAKKSFLEELKDRLHSLFEKAEEEEEEEEEGEWLPFG